MAKKGGNLFSPTLPSLNCSQIFSKNGKVCETNTTERIFKNPQNSYTKELLELMPKIESII